MSSFGVGGTNAHVVLEEAPPPAPPAPSRPWQLLVLSARSPAALDAATGNLAAALADGVPAGGSLADVAFTLSAGRRVFPHRRVLVAAGCEDAATVLAERPAERLPSAHDADDPRRRPVVFLLPGQGAQHAGMARRLYDGEPTFRRHLDRAAELLREPLAAATGGDGDLRRLLFPAPDADPAAAAARLEATAVAQPALFAVEVALARLWSEWGVEPAALIGHSLGELAAACLGGVVSFEDGLRLVAERGRLMQAAPAGAMLAVPLPADDVERRLEGFAGVELAAVNQPDRATVAGGEDAVAAFAAALAADGVAARRLHTSHAFHSAAMDGAVEPFRAAVAAVPLSPPSIPIVSNLTGTWLTDAEATDPAYWARHLRQRVRFADGLATLLADADRVLLEVGPGTTLTTLARRHPARAGQPVVHTLPHPRAGERGEGRAGRRRAGGGPRRPRAAVAGRRRDRLAGLLGRRDPAPPAAAHLPVRAPPLLDRRRAGCRPPRRPCGRRHDGRQAGRRRPLVPPRHLERRAAAAGRGGRRAAAALVGAGRRKPRPRARADLRPRTRPGWAVPVRTVRWQTPWSPRWRSGDDRWRWSKPTPRRRG